MGEKTMEEVRLEQLHQIAAKRDQEYNGIKKLLDERQEDLDRRERDLEERSRKLDEQKERFYKREKELLAAEEENAACRKEIADRNAELEKKAEELTEKERAVEKRAADIALECSILKENVRNEELQATRLRMEWENKCSLLERTGEVPGEAAGQKEPEAYQELEGKLSEMSRELSDAREGKKVLEQENKRLEQEKEHLEREKERLEEEKGEILRKALGISKKEGAQKETQKRQPEASAKEPETGREELTAGVLHRYLGHYFPAEDLSVRHAEAGDQIHLAKGNLKYVFVFEEPARFDVRAERKKTKVLIQRMEEMKAGHPGLEFAYDEAQGEVVVSGYFTKETLPGTLMEKVTEVSELFHT